MLVIGSAEGVAGITAGATLLAALGLAGVTIYTTNRRVSAESDRQKREIDERTKGQKRLLDHQRELADLADLRTLLDEFALALDRARTARDEMVVLAQTARRRRSTIDTDIGRTAGAAKQVGQELLALTMRLRVRLGSENPLAVASEEVADAVPRMWVQVEQFGNEMSLSDARELFGLAQQDFGRWSTEFTFAAVKRAGTVDTRGPSEWP
jgi:hypothetical protein